MDPIRARAMINADGTVTFRVAPGTPAAECEVILLPVKQDGEAAAAAARVRALAGAWADWDEFDEFVREIDRRSGGQG